MFPRYIVNLSDFRKGARFYKFESAESGRQHNVANVGVPSSEAIALTNIDYVITNQCMWVEVSQEGFERVLAWADIPTDSLDREAAREYVKPYRVYPKPPPTNHKIGVPKNKLP